LAGGIPTYAALRVRDLYPGIDLVYYTGRHGLEYDFVVGPGPIRAASASPPPGLRRTPGMAIWSGAPRAACWCSPRPRSTSAASARGRPAATGSVRAAQTTFTVG